MLKVGITGGIGSGKTTVCQVFALLGVPVFYADTVAKTIMVTDQALVQGVKDTFGAQSYFNNNALNNKYIADIVFSDSAALAKLNALVHPAVFRAFDNWVTGQQAVPYVLKEAALLFESDSYKMCDKTILVTAPETLKIQRVMQRDNISETQVKARMDKQLTDAEKSERADYLVVNDGVQSIIEQVLQLHKIFSSGQ